MIGPQEDYHMGHQSCASKLAQDIGDGWGPACYSAHRAPGAALQLRRLKKLVGNEVTETKDFMLSHRSAKNVLNVHGVSFQAGPAHEVPMRQGGRSSNSSGSGLFDPLQWVQEALTLSQGCALASRSKVQSLSDSQLWDVLINLPYHTLLVTDALEDLNRPWMVVKFGVPMWIQIWVSAALSYSIWPWNKQDADVRMVWKGSQGLRSNRSAVDSVQICRQDRGGKVDGPALLARWPSHEHRPNGSTWKWERHLVNIGCSTLWKEVSKWLTIVGDVALQLQDTQKPSESKS